MGNKAAKQYLMKRKCLAGKNAMPEGSDEDLAEFLAALSNMANRGSKPMSEGMPTPQRLVGSTNGRYSAPASTSFRERRKRYKATKNYSDDSSQSSSSGKPEVGAFLQDDNGDWAEMRQWLVWCMQSSLRDDIEMYRTQSSFDSNTET